MPHCKQCGKKFSFLAEYRDGLCEDCHQIASHESEIKENERTQQLLEDSKKNIDLIIKAMTDETPLNFVFVNWGIEKKSDGFLKKIPGLALGLAVGGPLGEMVFGGTLLSKGECAYAGELGILVVTAKQILIGHSTTPFQGPDGRIVPDHLQLLARHFSDGTISRKAFNISQTMMHEGNAVMDLKCGNETLSVHKSELSVIDTIYEMASLAEISSQIGQLDFRVSGPEFCAKLKQGENPLSKKQVEEAMNDNAYITAMLDWIISHKKRDREILVQNFSYLTPEVKAAFEARIKSKGDSRTGVCKKLIIACLLEILGISIVFFAFDNAPEFIGWLSGGVAVIAGLGIWVFAMELIEANWCRRYYEDNIY